MVSFEVTAQSVTGSGTASMSFVENWIFDEKLHAPSKIRKISPQPGVPSKRDGNLEAEGRGL